MEAEQERERCVGGRQAVFMLVLYDRKTVEVPPPVYYFLTV